MSGGGNDWRPTATRAALQRRAQMLATARNFFAQRGVMDVDTPIVVNAPVTDVHIHSAQVRLGDRTYFLHTSPEYAMKRLLAAGSGDIYQICHVVRDFERSRLHNAEFTLIEWYRIGFTAAQLMDEVEALTRELLGAKEALASERVSYRDVFMNALRIDPLTASLDELKGTAADLGLQTAFSADSTRDDLLDLLMGVHIGPKLGERALTFVHGYPASQAALARLDPDDPRTALRFELYYRGTELANGFQELASAAEQRDRFEQDRRERQRRGLPVHAPDERLLAALEAGLPECSGVAVGFDRLVMLASGANHIDEVLPFALEHA
jgi:lysyl-tRNA synthetase class 2